MTGFMQNLQEYNKASISHKLISYMSSMTVHKTFDSLEILEYHNQIELNTHRYIFHIVVFVNMGNRYDKHILKQAVYSVKKLLWNLTNV